MIPAATIHRRRGDASNSIGAILVLDRRVDRRGAAIGLDEAVPIARHEEEVSRGIGLLGRC